MVRKALLLFIFFLPLSLFAQSEWEDATPSGLKWDIDLKLSWYNTTLTNLKVANLIPETKEDKKNKKWRSYNAELNYQIKESRPFEITFDVTNLNNRADYKYAVYDGKKKKWHSKEIYWGYEIGVNTTSGSTQYFTRNYSDKKSDSYHHTSYTDTDSRGWSSYYGGKSHSIKIEYNGDHTIKVFDNGTLVKTFYNSKSICYLGFKVGTAALVQATNLKIRRKSNYGMAKPKIDEAMSKMQKQEWYNAARDLSYVIGTLRYTDYSVYYTRGVAYAMQENYRTAIEDFSKALNLTGLTSEQREGAYYVRGLCRASIGDDECVNDMRKAGQDGKIWLRENQLEDYIVGSGNNNAGRQSNSTSDSNHLFLPEKFRK